MLGVGALALLLGHVAATAGWPSSPPRPPPLLAVPGPSLSLVHDGQWCGVTAGSSLPPPSGITLDGGAASAAGCPRPWAASVGDSFLHPARAVAGAPAARLINTTTTLLRAEAPTVCGSHTACMPVGLQLLLTTHRYSDFPGAIESVARLQLAGVHRSRVCDLADADWVLPVAADVDVTLFSQNGSALPSHLRARDFSARLTSEAQAARTASVARTDFAPLSPISLRVGNHTSSTTQSGLPSSMSMPVFSLQIGGQGIVWIIGWSGNWQQVSRSDII